MQQVETFLCNGEACDRKIACEMVIEPSPQPPIQTHYDQDFPAESFYLPKEDELEWFNRNVFYDRNDSKKTNSISNPNSHSQRFSMNLKSQKNSIIGLPKPQDARFVVSKVQPKGKPSTFRLFSKRYRSSNRSSSEPSSPKVSCIGRVRSKRVKNRCRSNGSSAFEPDRPGFWSSLKKKLQCSCMSGDMEERFTKTTSSRRTTEKQKTETSETSVVEPPGLGGMNRFVSGRRSDSWAGDLDKES